MDRSPPNYALDDRAIPGTIVIWVDGHPPYLAETMHTGDIFARQLIGDLPLLLPAKSEATQRDDLFAAVNRVLTRIEFDHLADQLAADRALLYQEYESAVP